MACWSLQSRNAKALRCSQTNDLASFTMTTITPVNSTYIYMDELIFPPQRAQRRLPTAAVCAQVDA